MGSDFIEFQPKERQSPLTPREIRMGVIGLGLFVIAIILHPSWWLLAAFIGGSYIGAIGESQARRLANNKDDQ